jgi:hypothetical protein
MAEPQPNAYASATPSTAPTKPPTGNMALYWARNIPYLSDDETGYPLTDKGQGEFRLRARYLRVLVSHIEGVHIPDTAPLLWTPYTRAKQLWVGYDSARDPVYQLSHKMPRIWRRVLADMVAENPPSLPRGCRGMNKDEVLGYTGPLGIILGEPEPHEMKDVWTPVEQRAMNLHLLGMDPDIAAAGELGRRVAQEEISRRKAEGITSNNDANSSSLHDQEVSAQDFMDPALLAWDGRGEGEGRAERGTSVANPSSPHDELSSTADETLAEWGADMARALEADMARSLAADMTRACEARVSKASI